MDPYRFVRSIRENVLEGNIKMYVEDFESTEIIDVPDGYYEESLVLYRNLSPHDRKIFLSVITQTIVDTISHVLGIIDGSSYSGLEDEDIVLYAKRNGEEISGDLQNIFLANEDQ